MENGNDNMVWSLAGPHVRSRRENYVHVDGIVRWKLVGEWNDWGTTGLNQRAKLLASPGSRRTEDEFDDVYGDAEGDGVDGGEGRGGVVPLGKEPQLWEFARDVVTSLVSDLAVVSAQ